MPLLIATVLLVGAAHAQDAAPPPDAPPPATLPAPPATLPAPPATMPAPPATVPTPPPEERPLAVPAAPPPPPVTAARLQALRGYKAGRLELRNETELRGGSAWVMGGGYGGMWGPGYGAWGVGGPVIVDPPTALRTWGIYRGPERLPVPDFLSVVGEAERKRELDAVLERLARRSKAWSVVAVVGGAGLAAGLIGMSSVETREEYQTFNAVTLGGTLVMATGFVGSSFPSGKGSALRRYPSSSMGSDQAQAMVDQHNEALRKELGLSAADVWALETD
jgi:hypothetical protein